MLSFPFQMRGILILRSSSHWGEEAFIHHMGATHFEGKIMATQMTIQVNKNIILKHYYLFSRKVIFTFIIQQNTVSTFTSLVLQVDNVNISFHSQQLISQLFEYLVICFPISYSFCSMFLQDRFFHSYYQSMKFPYFVSF